MTIQPGTSQIDAVSSIPRAAASCARRKAPWLKPSSRKPPAAARPGLPSSFWGSQPSRAMRSRTWRGRSPLEVETADGVEPRRHLGERVDEVASAHVLDRLARAGRVHRDRHLGRRRRRGGRRPRRARAPPPHPPAGPEAASDSTALRSTASPRRPAARPAAGPLPNHRSFLRRWPRASRAPRTPATASPGVPRRASPSAPRRISTRRASEHAR